MPFEGLYRAPHSLVPFLEPAIRQDCMIGTPAIGNLSLELCVHDRAMTRISPKKENYQKSKMLKKPLQ